MSKSLVGVGASRFLAKINLLDELLACLSYKIHTEFVTALGLALSFSRVFLIFELEDRSKIRVLRTVCRASSTP